MRIRLSKLIKKYLITVCPPSVSLLFEWAATVVIRNWKWKMQINFFWWREGEKRRLWESFHFLPSTKRRSHKLSHSLLHFLCVCFACGLWKWIYSLPSCVKFSFLLPRLSLYLSLPIHKNKYESERKTRKNFAYHQIFVECRVSLYISRHNCTFQFELKIWIYFSSLSHLPYLSLYPSSCRAKFVPDFLPTEEVAPARSTLPTVSSDGGEAKTDEKFAPPTPEEAERIISNLLPR